VRQAEQTYRIYAAGKLVHVHSKLAEDVWLGFQGKAGVCKAHRLRKFDIV
jgi:hypothetical protein